MRSQIDRYGSKRVDPCSTNGRYRLWWRAVRSGVRTDVLSDAYNVSVDVVQRGIQIYRRHLEQA